MAESSYPKVGDATTDKQYRDLFNVIIETGVTTPTGCATTADSTGMNVKVAAGMALVSGIAYQNNAVKTLNIGTAPGAGQSRIDTAVLQLDYTKTPTVQAVLIAGTAAASGAEVPPTLTPAGNIVWNMPLADIAVGSGVVTINPGNVTDRRTYTGTNVQTWTTATRPAAPALKTFGYNSSTNVWEGYTGSAWVTVSAVPGGAVGTQVYLAATIPAGREALGIYVQPTAPPNVAGRVWIKTAS